MRQKLPAALGCPPDKTQFSIFDDNSMAGFTVDCSLPLQRHATQISGDINLQQVQEALAGVNVKKVFVTIAAPLSGGITCSPEPSHRETTSQVSICNYTLEGSSSDARSVHFTIGYGAAHVERIVLILAGLLLIPILLSLWFRGRARDVPDEAKPDLLFSYRRFIHWTAMFGALVWWSALDALHADTFVQFVFPATNSKNDVLAFFLPWIVLWFPAIAVYFVCLLLASPLHGLRGTSRTLDQAFKQSFWGIARFVLPILFLMLGVAELFSSPRLAALFFAAWIVTARIVNQRFADSWGMHLRAVTAGELRNRAFEIAKKAKTRLNQLYVYPTEHIRMANAFAHAAHNIFLTDYLVKNLSKNEVDAVIGHEIAHIQKKHIRTRIVGFVALCGVIGAVSGWVQNWFPENFPVGPCLYGALLVTNMFVSRRNEFAADKGAYALTGDAEAMITGLARITLLNTMPIHWNQLDEKMLTHPSTLRRIQNLARIGNVPESRIPILLEQAKQPVTNTYEIPSSAALAGKVFSTRWKYRTSWSYGWALLLAMAAIPCITVLAMQWARLSGRGLDLALIAGFLLTIAGVLEITNVLPTLSNPKLESKLREKLLQDGKLTGADDGVFVGLIPDSSPRVYEGNWSWDVGILRLTNDRLFYDGEEARFSVRRDEITCISAGPKTIGWLAIPSAGVEWQHSSGQRKTFSLRAFSARSSIGMSRNTQKLISALESWVRVAALPPDSLLTTARTAPADVESYGRPEFGEVTSISPKRYANRNMLARYFLLDTFVAAFVAVLFGIPVPVLNDLAPLSAPLTVLSSGAASLYVLGTVWLTRAFQLFPYWRFREPKASTVAKGSAPAQATST